MKSKYLFPLHKKYANKLHTNFVKLFVSEKFSDVLRRRGKFVVLKCSGILHLVGAQLKKLHKELSHISTTMIVFGSLQTLMSLQVLVIFQINAPKE